MTAADAQTPGALDEAYERLLGTGPEFEGWLSNHGPMAAEALVQMGLADQVHRWLDWYSDRLEDAPRGTDPIARADWQDALGDPRRLGDWLRYFVEELDGRDWREVLVQWWPRLVPGAVASSTHGLIRTGHAVRALLAVETQPRRAELGQALGYWAARWQTLPAPAAAVGGRSAREALDAVPLVPEQTGDATFRLAQLGRTRGWTDVVASLTVPATAQDVPAALASLTDAAVERYVSHGHGHPIMLVHAATAPSSALLVLPVLPTDLWLSTHAALWRASAAITAAYSPAESWRGPVATPEPTAAETAERALANRDEHVIKFTETALRAEQRGLADARTAAAMTVQLNPRP